MLITVLYVCINLLFKNSCSNTIIICLYLGVCMHEVKSMDMHTCVNACMHDLGACVCHMISKRCVLVQDSSILEFVEIAVYV